MNSNSFRIQILKALALMICLGILNSCQLKKKAPEKDEAASSKTDVWSQDSLKEKGRDKESYQGKDRNKENEKVVEKEIPGIDRVRVKAAQITASKSIVCKKIEPFYWEIGNGKEVLLSGLVGDHSMTREQKVAVGASGNWLVAAYGAQKSKGKLGPAAIKSFSMSSGLSAFEAKNCLATSTVKDCWQAAGQVKENKKELGKFAYNSAHFQKWAMNSGLGRMTKQQLGQEFRKVLGSDLNVDFNSPVLAGGLELSSATYALFLKKLIQDKLFLSQLLGAKKVCTDPLVCKKAISSPLAGENLHYSLGHWVEDAPGKGDGAFSSPGEFGFYPWINAKKTHYGIIGRFDRSLNTASLAKDSIECGRIIRKAFEAGTVQVEQISTVK